MISQMSFARCRKLPLFILKNISAPRTICYTQSSTERTFNYQIPKKNINVELKGNTVKKVAPPETREEIM